MQYIEKGRVRERNIQNKIYKQKIYTFSHWWWLLLSSWSLKWGCGGEPNFFTERDEEVVGWVARAVVGPVVGTVGWALDSGGGDGGSCWGGDGGTQQEREII